jgi:2-keto-4-pentenoate hydratase/2-oxohepta-3-ene-1,7-dioic acid hydratase in catechol pathway
MKLATVKIDDYESAVIVLSNGILPLKEVNALFKTQFPLSLFELINGNHIQELKKLFDRSAPSAMIPFQDIQFAPPYRRPGKIWGIGLNYSEHASDLEVSIPEQPASFMKPATTIIGHGDTIKLPAGSTGVTAEAELGVIISKKCRNISREEAADCILGYTCIIDMTEEDILKVNPRYLTRAKSYDTFFSFGPVLLTPGEIPDISTLSIKTVVNGETRAENTVSNMTFDPLEIVSFHSHVMTLEPGDIFSTGTPGRWHLQDGDNVRCEITGFPALACPVERERGLNPSFSFLNGHTI